MSDQRSKAIWKQWETLSNDSRRKDVLKLVGGFIRRVGGPDRLAEIYYEEFERASSLRRLRCCESFLKLMKLSADLEAIEKEGGFKSMSDAELANQILEIQFKSALSMPLHLLREVARQRGVIP